MPKFWKLFFRRLYASKPLCLSILLLIALFVFSLGFRLGREWTNSLNVISKPSVVSPPVSSISPQVSGWKIYSNPNYGFAVEYPSFLGNSSEAWQYEEFFDSKNPSVAFGPVSSKPGGYMWGISIYPKQPVSQLIKQVGSQFSDRKEAISQVTISHLPALLVTVTTSKNPTWVSKTVYIESGDKLFVLSNGATGLGQFDAFYKSFRLLN